MKKAKALEPAIPNSTLGSPMAPKEPDDYEKERMAQTLMDAEDIKNDPEKMGHVQAHLKKKMGKIKSIQDLKDLHKMKYGKGASKKEEMAEGENGPASAQEEAGEGE